jgi:hypothetical protein
MGCGGRGVCHASSSSMRGQSYLRRLNHSSLKSWTILPETYLPTIPSLLLVLPIPAHTI